MSLEKHLSYLRNQGLITIWSDRQILPGNEWRQEIDIRLKRAGIILLLVSPDFLASNYSGLEMQKALERHQANETIVIPIIVQPCDWIHASLRTYKSYQRMPTLSRIGITRIRHFLMLRMGLSTPLKVANYHKYYQKYQVQRRYKQLHYPSRFS